MTTLMDPVGIQVPRNSPVKADSPGGPPARHLNRVTIPRAFVRGRVARRIRSDSRGSDRLPRRRGADVYGAHSHRDARQGSAARHHELIRSNEPAFRRARLSNLSSLRDASTVSPP